MKVLKLLVIPLVVSIVAIVLLLIVANPSSLKFIYPDF